RRGARRFARPPRPPVHARLHRPAVSVLRAPPPRVEISGCPTERARGRRHSPGPMTDVAAFPWTFGIEEEFFLAHPKSRSLSTSVPRSMLHACRRRFGD